MSPRSAAARRLPQTDAAPRRRPTLTAIPGGASSRRSRLQAVRAPLQARSRVPFLMLCMAILSSALLCVLLLNTTMARGSFEMSDLRQQVGRSAQDAQRLQSEIRGAEARLPETARRYGMVPAGEPRILRLAAPASPAIPGTSEAEGAP